MEVVVFGLAIAALVGVLIAESKGRSKAEGLGLGCLLGPIGWLIEALLPSKKEETATQGVQHPTRSESSRPRRKCPYCAEYILREAKVCKHCGRDVEPETNEDDEGRPCNYCDNLIPTDAQSCPYCDAPYPFMSSD